MRKAHSFQTIKEILITQLEDLNKNCVQISCPHMFCFQRNKPSKNVMIRSGRDDSSLILSDSASPKKSQKNIFQLFSKDLELLKCSQGDPYMTANRNFVRFAHS